jgi:AraC-like DNA-binding protein
LDSKEIFFNLNPVNFFIASALIQNFVIAGILFFRQGENHLANRLLSTTIVIVNLHLTYLMVLDTNLDNLFPFLLWIPYSYLTAVGPLIFLYTKALTDRQFRISGIGSRHFVPVMAEVGLQIVMIVQAISNDGLFYNTPPYFYVMPFVYAWAIGSIFYYLNLSVVNITNHETWALKNFSNMKEITLTWLEKLIRYYRLLWSVWMPFVAAFLLFFRFQLMYLGIVLFLYLLMLILTYQTFWIGLQGLRHGNFVFLKPNDSQADNKNFSKLSTGEIQEYMKRITWLMTGEKKYLNENLSLRELALYLEADPNLISFILNKHLGSSFYDFVNRYRIEEVKNKLNDPANKHLNLLGIALDSGFNSKTTFNRVFKQVTGLTPTEFQKGREDSHR